MGLGLGLGLGLRSGLGLGPGLGLGLGLGPGLGLGLGFTFTLMERQVSAAYVALVLGFLCRDAADLCATALAELGEPTFERAAQILQVSLS